MATRCLVALVPMLVLLHACNGTGIDPVPFLVNISASSPENATGLFGPGVYITPRLLIAADEVSLLFSEPINLTSIAVESHWGAYRPTQIELYAGGTLVASEAFPVSGSCPLCAGGCAPGCASAVEVPVYMEDGATEFTFITLGSHNTADRKVIYHALSLTAECVLPSTCAVGTCTNATDRTCLECADGYNKSTSCMTACVRGIPGCLRSECSGDRVACRQCIPQAFYHNNSATGEDDECLLFRMTLPNGILCSRECDVAFEMPRALGEYTWYPEAHLDVLGCTFDACNASPSSLVCRADCSVSGTVTFKPQAGFMETVYEGITYGSLARSAVVLNVDVDPPTATVAPLQGFRTANLTLQYRVTFNEAVIFQGPGVSVNSFSGDPAAFDLDVVAENEVLLTVYPPKNDFYNVTLHQSIEDLAGNAMEELILANVSHYVGFCDPVIVASAAGNSRCSGSQAETCHLSCPLGMDPVAGQLRFSCVQTASDAVEWNVTAAFFCTGGFCQFRCKSCVPGFFSDGLGLCEACPAGFYSELAQARSCTGCPEDTYLNATGAVSMDMCRPCDDGEFAPPGSAQCTPCQAGEFLNASNLCEACPPNRYAPRGSIACSLCLANEKVSQNRSMCVPCSAGEFSPPGMSVCTACPVHSVPKADGSGCRECGPVEVAGLTSRECRTCSAGHVPNDDLSDCRRCPPWQFNLPASPACTDCPIASVPTADQGACAACPAHTVAGTNSVNCTTCGGGERPSPDQNACEPCPAGAVAPPASAVCTPCDADAFFTPNEGRTACECAVGYYPKGQECIECPEGATCDGGTSLPENLEGYYCSDPEEFVFAACPQPEACLEECECREFHDPASQGCQACMLGAYRKSASQMCQECPDANLPLLIILGVVAIVVGSALFIVLARKSKAYFPSLVVALNFIQVVSVLGELSLSWPPSLVDFFNRLRIFSIDIEIVHPECALRANTAFVTIWTLKFLTPVFVLAFFAITYACAWPYYYYVYRNAETTSTTETTKNKKAPWLEHLRDFKYNLINAFFTMLTVAYLMACLTSLQIFSCTSIKRSDGSSTRVLNGDPNIVCDTAVGPWGSLVGVATIGILFYVFGIPLLVSWILWRNKDRLGQASVMAKYGLLYRRFQKNRFFWELVIMMRKLVLVVARTFFVEYPGIQVALCLLSALVGLAATYRFRPFASKEVNRLEEWCLASASVIVAAGAIYSAAAPTADVTSSSSPGAVVLAVFCILVWAVCIVLLLVVFIRELRRLRERLRFGVPDGDAGDDIVLLPEFKAMGGRIYEYTTSDATIHEEMHVHIALSFGDASDARLHAWLEPFDEEPSQEEATKESVKVVESGAVASTLVQTVPEHEDTRRTFTVDAVTPAPARYTLKVAATRKICGNGELREVMHCHVDARDGEAVEYPFKTGGVVRPPEGSGVVVHSPMRATLAVHDRVTFRISVPPSCESVFLEHVRRVPASPSPSGVKDFPPTAHPDAANDDDVHGPSDVRLDVIELSASGSAVGGDDPDDPDDAMEGQALCSQSGDSPHSGAGTPGERLRGMSLLGTAQQPPTQRTAMGLGSNGLYVSPEFVVLEGDRFRVMVAPSAGNDAADPLPPSSASVEVAAYGSRAGRSRPR